MKIQDFREEDWTVEISSGFNGFRNKKTNDWVYQEDFQRMKTIKSNYERAYKLLSEFRSECLPFGKYGENVIQDFLNKRYNG